MWVDQEPHCPAQDDWNDVPRLLADHIPILLADYVCFVIGKRCGILYWQEIIAREEPET
jgi:hypothetical protein